MLRRYAEHDLGDVLDIWYRASVIAHPFLPDEFMREERREIAERWLPIAETTVAVVEERLVGFLALIGNEVGAIFVDPDHQGLGIGRALMNDARARRPFLELDVFEANATGRRFYDSYGFEQVRRHVHDATGQSQLRLRIDADAPSHPSRGAHRIDRTHD